MRSLVKVVLISVACFFSSCKVIEEEALTPANCQGEMVETTHSASIKIDSVLQNSIEGGVTGVAVYVHSDTKGIFKSSYGTADLSINTPMEVCTKFRVASLTKVFTATAILMLVENGKITLATKVGSYLEDSKVSGIQDIDEIEIEQLLNHTSGIPNYDDDIRFAPMILNNPGGSISLEQKLNLVRNSGGRVPDWVIKKFGQIYSNTNYLLLQLIIEKASGVAYEKFVRDNIIDKLGLKNTSFGKEKTYPNGLAMGYVDFYGNGIMRNVNEWDANRFDAEGDLISTVGDLSNFYKSLLSGKIISVTMLEAMKNRRLGLLQEEFELENAIGHDGIAIGYSAEMWYLERSGLLVVLLANQGRLVNENWSVLKYENLLRQIIEVARKG